MARKRIGELLLERRLLTPEQLEVGLAHHRQAGVRLGVALVEKGFLSEAQLCGALSEALGIPAVDLGAVQPDWTAIHMLRPRFCEAHDLFPFAMVDAQADGARKQLRVAMADPLNLPALEEIEFTTGLKVIPALSPRTQIHRAIRRYHYRQRDAEDGDDGSMTVLHRGETLTVPAAPPPPPEEEEVVIEGVPVDPEPPEPRDALSSLSRDLDYLLDLREEPDRVEKLERKFWALMRLMAKKGLLSPEEFRAELGEDGE